MCEFTVYLDGHEDGDIVAEKVIKATVKDGRTVLIDNAGKTYRVDNAVITKVDTIMAELILKTAE